MRYECTRWGILIDEKYLSAREAVDLSHWLAAQQEWLSFISQQEIATPPEAEAPVTSEQQQGEWSEEEELEILSEDEQIVNL